jgi:hypothetical protein
MEARSATLRDMDDVPRRRARLVDRRQRHRLGRHARQAEGKSERGSSKNLHRVFPFVFAADAAQSGLRKQYGSPVTHGVTETDRPTNGDGANGDAASGAAAKPNAGASNACANDAGANAIAGASEKKREFTFVIPGRAERGTTGGLPRIQTALSQTQLRDLAAYHARAWL